MSPHILLIEDTEDLGEVICDILRMAGFKVDWAKNGKMGIDFFCNQKPDLIITDMVMPELNGLDVIKYVRLHDSAIPIIILSAKASPEDQTLGLEIGASLYLKKPCSNATLIESILNLLAYAK